MIPHVGGEGMIPIPGLGKPAIDALAMPLTPCAESIICCMLFKVSAFFQLCQNVVPGLQKACITGNERCQNNDARHHIVQPGAGLIQTGELTKSFTVFSIFSTSCSNFSLNFSPDFIPFTLARSGSNSSLRNFSPLATAVLTSSCIGSSNFSISAGSWPAISST